MIVLIDGYNVLKQISSATHKNAAHGNALHGTAVHISSAQRRVFINRLHEYALRHGHQIFLVFDGTVADDDYVPSSRSLSVLYSGHTKNADLVLKKLCTRYKGYEVVLVSSDRDVCAYASLCGIACLDALMFYKLLVHKAPTSTTTTLKSQGNAVKRFGHESNQEVDELMQQASKVLVVKQEDGAVTREKNAQMLSKKDKKLKKLVNKL